MNTHCDDIVGSDGPMLQVQSDNEAFNTAAEQVWQDWFAAPTPRRNVSGAALLKLWIRALWRSGEFLGELVTDDQAEGPVAVKYLPIHPRRLTTPIELTGDPFVFMGIRVDRLGRPSQYYINQSPQLNGQQAIGAAVPRPPDLIVHEYVLEEEDQLRGYPWATAGLEVASALRDYDDRVQDAAQQIADQSAMLYTEHPDAVLWQLPEETKVQRRTVRMLPPGWKPFVYPATQPAVQYPDYRAERLRELGRPVGMPLLMVRLDASKHSYSSARLDTQVYRRAVAALQTWLSGSERSIGTLSRLATMVINEARFLNTALRTTPPVVHFRWIWPQLPHVDPQKEEAAETTALQNGTQTITGALAAKGKTTTTHLAEKRREIAEFAAAGVPYPTFGAQPAAGPEEKGDEDSEQDGSKEEDSEEEEPVDAA